MRPLCKGGRVFGIFPPYEEGTYRYGKSGAAVDLEGHSDALLASGAVLVTAICSI
jgi:hypothetical protein